MSDNSNSPETDNSTSSRCRRRANSSKHLHGKVVELQNTVCELRGQIEQMHTKLDLVIGGLSILMDKGIISSSDAGYVDYQTPPHNIGPHSETVPACGKVFLDGIDAELHFESNIPDFPFPSVVEATPRIDMAKVLDVPVLNNAPVLNELVEQYVFVSNYEFAELVDQPSNQVDDSSSDRIEADSSHDTAFDTGAVPFAGRAEAPYDAASGPAQA